MKIRKSHMVAVAVLASGLMAAGIGAVSAAEISATKNPMSDLVAAISAKFNLNANDVQAVFDAQKTKMQADRKVKMADMQTKRQQQFADRLTKAVTDGKLTQDQANKITAKKAELEAARTALVGKTKEEQSAAMKAQNDSLTQWLKDNNIPAGYLPCGAGIGGWGIGGRGHGFGK